MDKPINYIKEIVDSNDDEHTCVKELCDRGYAMSYAQARMMIYQIQDKNKWKEMRK